MADYTRFTNVETTLLKVDGEDYNTRVAAVESGVAAVDGKIAASAKGGMKVAVLSSPIFEELVSGTAFKLDGAVPKDALITQVTCFITVGFDSGSTDTLTIGIQGTENKFLGTSDITAKTTGVYPKVVGYDTDNTALDVYAKWTGTGTAATKGEFLVYVTYIDISR